jgi:hypothetical protein
MGVLHDIDRISLHYYQRTGSIEERVQRKLTLYVLVGFNSDPTYFPFFGIDYLTFLFVKILYSRMTGDTDLLTRRLLILG